MIKESEHLSTKSALQDVSRNNKLIAAHSKAHTMPTSPISQIKNVSMHKQDQNTNISSGQHKRWPTADRNNI